MWSSQSCFFCNATYATARKARKVQAWTRFEAQTSAMPVQRSTSWAIMPTWSWLLCGSIISPYMLGIDGNMEFISTCLAISTHAWKIIVTNIELHSSFTWTPTRYQFSLNFFYLYQESAANEWEIDLNTRREISYLQANMCPLCDKQVIASAFR